MEKKMETTTMGYIGTTIRIHSFMLSQPKASLGGQGFQVLGFRMSRAVEFQVWSFWVLVEIPLKTDLFY